MIVPFILDLFKQVQQSCVCSSLQHKCALAHNSVAGVAGGELIADMVSTTVPRAVAHPRGSNAFGILDGTATQDPTMAKRLSVDVEALNSGDPRSASVIDRENHPLPSEEEALTLRKVPDTIPPKAYLLCIVELAE